MINVININGLKKKVYLTATKNVKIVISITLFLLDQPCAKWVHSECFSRYTGFRLDTNFLVAFMNRLHLHFSHLDLTIIYSESGIYCGFLVWYYSHHLHLGLSGTTCHANFGQDWQVLQKCIINVKTVYAQVCVRNSVSGSCSIEIRIFN